MSFKNSNRLHGGCVFFHSRTFLFLLGLTAVFGTLSPVQAEIIALPLNGTPMALSDVILPTSTKVQNSNSHSATRKVIHVDEAPVKTPSIKISANAFDWTPAELKSAAFSASSILAPLAASAFRRDNGPLSGLEFGGPAQLQAALTPDVWQPFSPEKFGDPQPVVPIFNSSLNFSFD